MTTDTERTQNVGPTIEPRIVPITVRLTATMDRALRHAAIDAKRRGVGAEIAHRLERYDELQMACAGVLASLDVGGFASEPFAKEIAELKEVLK